MLFPQEAMDSWSEKYGLKISSGKCPACNRNIVADIPFADKSLRGFISGDHGCGIQYCLITFKDISQKEKVFWERMAQGVAAP